MSTIISNGTLTVNNSPVAYKPNSLVFTEGAGEQSIMTQSSGGGAVQTVYSNNVETNKSMVKFSILSTAANVDLVKTWKKNFNRNAITVSGSDPVTGAQFTRTFQTMALINNYEVNLVDQGDIALEFEGAPAV